MKSKAAVLQLLLLLPLCLFAQSVRSQQQNNSQLNNHVTRRGQTSMLTIFSPGGDKFFLVINGLKQNNFPQSRITVQALPQFTNDVEVIFADNQTPAIRKTITLTDPVDGEAIYLVLGTERNQQGYMRLRFFKATAVTNDYHGEPGESVMDYCHDNNNRHDPLPPPAPLPMDDQTFRDMKASIQSSGFDETKLSTAKTVVGANWVTTDQVIEVCKLMGWDESKMDFAKFAYDRTLDVNNYFKVAGVFSWDSEKEDLNKFITSKHK